MGVPFPIPPISISPASSAQSGSRSDSTQGGVRLDTQFGAFNLTGGGVNLQNTAPGGATQLTVGTTQGVTSDNTTTYLYVGLAAVGGILLWMYLQNRK